MPPSPETSSPVKAPNGDTPARPRTASADSMGSGVASVLSVALPGKVLLDSQSLKQRLGGEMILFKRYWKLLVFCVVVVYYLAALPMRRLAFHFHKPMQDYFEGVLPHRASVAAADVRWINGSGVEVSLASMLPAEVANVTVSLGGLQPNYSKPLILWDAGQEIFAPTLDHGYEKNPTKELLNEVVQFFMLGTCLFVGVLPVFYDGKTGRRPFLVNIIARYLRTNGFCHVLRPICYLVTMLPGPAMHCQSTAVGGLEELNHPDLTFGDIFGTVDKGFVNCGDTIFSGHMANATATVMVVLHYADDIFIPWVARAFKAVMILGIIFQPYTMLASRQHYTVDVFVSVYTTVLVWFMMLRFYPVDDDPFQGVEKRPSEDIEEGCQN